jgi:hypothetical protein
MRNRLIQSADDAKMELVGHRSGTGVSYCRVFEMKKKRTRKGQSEGEVFDVVLICFVICDFL